MAGEVIAGEHRVDKPGLKFDVHTSIRLRGRKTHRFVSRGGLKLEGAFQAFDLDVSGCIALDLGASTGGFTDCLLQSGVRRVYAVDVGYISLTGLFEMTTELSASKELTRGV